MNGGGTTRHIARILIRAIITLLMVATLNFILFRVIPGDPASLLLGGARASVTAEQIEAQRQNWGLTGHFSRTRQSTSCRQLSTAIWGTASSSGADVSMT